MKKKKYQLTYRWGISSLARTMGESIREYTHGPQGYSITAREDGSESAKRTIFQCTAARLSDKERERGGLYVRSSIKFSSVDIHSEYEYS